jgi:hypothetical protein
MRRRIAGLVLAALLAAWPSIAFATAYSPITYKFTVWQGGRTVNHCTQAGIIDVAVNHSKSQSRVSSGPTCTTALTNVPPGYLAVSVSGYRNGAFCGTSSQFFNQQYSASLWVNWQACTNPSGNQTFYTLANGAIYNDGSGGGSVHYHWSNTMSPSQNY